MADSRTIRLCAPVTTQLLSHQSAQTIRHRVVIIVSHPIQHFCPMYRAIAADPRLDLLVIFAEAGAEPKYDSGFGRIVEWQSDLLEGFPHFMIRCAESERTEAVLRELRNFNPDVIYVHGYASNYLREAI